MTRPPDVQIDDLAEPRFTPEIEAIITAVAPLGESASLDKHVLMAEAEAQAGLDDWGDAHFLEPLGVLLAALECEGDLSPMGRFSTHNQTVKLLVNRLLIQDLLVRHPEIHEVEIRRPIVIAGLPRTGTTHLHNLMSSDTSLRSMPYWESLEPVLRQQERPEGDQPDPRLARTEQALSILNQALPYFARMHEMTAWHVHEEIQLLAIDFSTMLFETTAVLPSWRDWYLAHDQTPFYDYLKTVLKVLQWQRGGNRWVLKSPQHLEQFGPLMRIFPDATVVVTHRDPVAITASLATMVAYTARMTLRRVDPEKIGRYWADRVQTMLTACVRDRALLPEERAIDVLFHEFMADDVATVETIYRLAGQPFTPEVRQMMERFMADNPRGRHGRVLYDLADFNLDAAERREALRFYTDRFAVREEL